MKPAILIGIALIAALATAQTASAACTCVCTPQGVMPYCQMAIEVPPICAPEVCPVAPPSVTPIMPPTVPPVGTTSCYPQQVFNPYTHQYEWQQVCR
jgi:hypothetical protein